MGSYWWPCSAKWTQPITLHSLAVAGIKNDSKTFTSLQVGEQIAEKIEQDRIGYHLLLRLLLID